MRLYDQGYTDETGVCLPGAHPFIPSSSGVFPILLYLCGFSCIAFQLNLFCYQEPAKDWLAEGKQQLSEGRFTEAVAAFTKYKRLAPEDPRPYFLSGLALAEADNLSEAASRIRRGVSPTRPRSARICIVSSQGADPLGAKESGS